MLGVRRRPAPAAALVALPPTPPAGDAAPARPRRFAGPREALAIRDFRFLFWSTVSSGYAQWAQTIGVGLLVYDLTGSAVQLAAVSATRGVVALVASPFVGTILDRYPRRDVLVSSTLLSAAQGIVLAFLVIAGYAHVWHAYIFMLLDGVFSTTNQNARQAFVYDVTTDATLPNAVALNAIAQNLSRITGPVLAAGLTGFFGIAAPFIVLGVLHALGAALTLPISKVTRQAAGLRLHPIRAPWEGFLYVRSEPALLGLMLIGTVPALLVYPYVQLLPVFAEDVLGGGALAYGMLAAAIGWGSITGLIGLAVIGGNVRHKGTVAIIGMIGYTTFLIVFSQSTVLWLSLLLLTIAGLFHGVSLTLQQTLVQLLARNDMRGRTTSLFQMGFALMPLGVLPMGLAVDHWGAGPGTAAFFAVAIVIFVLMGLFWRSLRTV
jgi:MFS family permease